jgi:antitoxin (DNA-binding transcriptional repressor) of toxin-antitoxin stability system
MRALERGKSFVVTRNGIPVDELTPLRRGRFVAADAAVGAFSGAPGIDSLRFRVDLDAVIEYDAASPGLGVEQAAIER